MSTGLLVRNPSAEIDTETVSDRWSDDFDEVSGLPVIESKAVEWQSINPLRSLFKELASQLSAEGRGEQIQAVKQVLQGPDWVQVQIRGEGAHRYGYLPSGATQSFPIDPAPVEQSDSWDF